MLGFGRRGVEKTEFTKKLLKSKLIAPPPKRIVWYYVKHPQDLLGAYKNERGRCGRYSWRVGQVFQEEQKKPHYAG